MYATSTLRVVVEPGGEGVVSHVRVASLSSRHHKASCPSVHTEVARLMKPQSSQSVDRFSFSGWRRISRGVTS